ncbi:hypothetical protein N7535_005994 [Penicillium sp. DV-2018c]|nr:hypothetical protein N7461_009573 [Penicillium sp. DV-2018c]KAJ5572334.1 hypothetical protein N7535_005994 [Penicillium sp. DV-2018c]
MNSEVDEAPMSSSNVPCPRMKLMDPRSAKMLLLRNNRRYWSIGSKFILKDRGINPPSYEVINTRFVAEKTTIPVPITMQEWTEGERYFQIVERVSGVPLEEIWSSITQPDRERLTSQTADYLNQFRSFHSPKMQSRWSTGFIVAIYFWVATIMFPTGH